MNLPSVATLEQLTDSRAEARILRTLLERFRALRAALGTPASAGARQAFEEFLAQHAPHTAHWANVQCFHVPNARERTLAAANELLGLHGVEALEDEHGVTHAYYCNTGDTYAPTLLFARGRFRVTSWGDFVETNRL